MDKNLLQLVKDKLKITWEDENTDRELITLIDDAENSLNNKLGAAIDYTAPGQERRLFLNYCLYAYNNMENEFDNNYLNEIMQIRMLYEVEQYEEDN